MPFIAMPILKTARQPDIPQLQARVESVSGIRKRGPVRREEEVISFTLDEVEINAVIVEKPIPWADLEGPCQTSFIWKDAAPQVRSHAAHIIACASSAAEETPPKVLAWYLTKGIEALLPTVDALGVYWGAGTLVMPRDIFMEMSAESSIEDLPLYLWIDFRCNRDSEGSCSLFTTGLKPLGFMEIEIAGAPRQPSELMDKAYNIAHYLLDNGPVVKDGDTIGTSADERIRVRHTKSFVKPAEKVYRLELL